MSSRLDFVRLLGSGPLVAALAPGSSGGMPPDLDPDDRLDGALVLSGGGASGAYEAGIIAALVRAAGVSDGERLPGFQAVFGTSIGSLNAYLVATAQYSRMAALWAGVTNQDLFALKRRFHDIVDSWSGLLNRLYAALALERGLVTNVRGVFERERLALFIARIVAGNPRPLIPLIFTATNLSDVSADVFYLGPQSPNPSELSVGQAALQSVIGRDTRAHEATPDILPHALLASTAIPVLFDPVELTFDGVTSQYIDGGVADNTPIDLARIIAKNVYAVLVDPQEPVHRIYDSALEIGFAAFGAAQRRILENALRSASLESEGKTLLRHGASTEGRAFLKNIYDSHLFTIRPASELAVRDFSSQSAIDAAYARGVTDGTTGWKPYVRANTRLAAR